ncbi:hypothetical protein TPHA_0D01570 [Tetrapisispora phaffii CBS 4417]|uniref:glucan 1,4-alpha-glucosidase n=1 Tax=Tetrapisispora phaffii (strain ATCC 24235 / CBS 4417 / NBRC 1672 / NRRL Y-8282 / UCD 70-5) TaxID=1071381 RepID=G8BSH6_TETPH|nr:hypothetical protein TPHA_0D01570 [Tetrapisispora phaffii CBS 4417]CCE62797.1 hypothetical protein TPHA_0D01570 [Tetrapisispora phaffii CBS 4417]
MRKGIYLYDCYLDNNNDVIANNRWRSKFRKFAFFISICLATTFVCVSLGGCSLASFGYIKSNFLFNDGYSSISSSSNFNTVNVTITDFNSHFLKTSQIQGLNYYKDDQIYNFFYEKIKLKKIQSQLINKNEFEDWLQAQKSNSLERLLFNVMDKNLNGHENLLNKNEKIIEGAIVASQSTQDPNYFFQWIRDSAIVINTVTDNIFDEKNYNITLVGTFLKYLNISYNLQRTDNLSGGSVPDGDLKGLGEPKWNVDNSPYNDNWGRPQNDGPPLRIIAILNFYSRLSIFNDANNSNVTVHDLIKEYNMKYTKLETNFTSETDIFNEIIYYDLKFIINNWKERNFDIWEEVNGIHFFTSLMQLTSIKMTLNYMKTSGSFTTTGKLKPMYDSLIDTYEKMYKFILLDSGFIINNDSKHHIVETPEILSYRSGLDIATIIASLLSHSTDNEFLDNSLPFDVDDSSILNSLYYLINEMSQLYPVNLNRKSMNMGVALGRYPEDVYDGYKKSEGNPWFLATSSASELIYQLIIKIKTLKQDILIPLATESKNNNDHDIFWTLIFDNIAHIDTKESNIKNGNSYQLLLPYNSRSFNQTLENLFKYGDSFLDCVREHSSEEGNLSEQFNKYTGFLQGAQDLTWSYNSFLSACQSRDKVINMMSFK